MEPRALTGGARLLVLPDAALAAVAAAEAIASALRASLEERGRFSLALSGGSTPGPMFEALARADLAWQQVDVFQVDERVVPLTDAARNAQQLEAALLSHVSIPRSQIHLIPVESAGVVRDYAQTLEGVVGSPAVLDVVHLGLGDDGHTASLVPGDPALQISDADVAAVAPYKGHARVTLTLPVLNRARQLVWLVCGASKQSALAQLIEGRSAAPAGRVARERALIVTDRAALPS